MTGAGDPPVTTDPRVPLTNLAAVRTRLDSLSHYLHNSVNSNTLLPIHVIDSVNSELSSAIHQVIINGAALLAAQIQPDPNPKMKDGEDVEIIEDPNANLNPARSKSAVDTVPRMNGEDLEIVEFGAVELLAEHIHVCEFCGKGFKRDANLRMHMRAHGDQYKTPHALAKPHVDAEVGSYSGVKKGFSCPYVGCNRNKESANFRPMKSVVCVKNHYKRSHCPKMYTCNRCNKKSFSVIGDLRSHIKVCGEDKWKCCCGTSFTRKDKLFAHMALFEGHMPAIDVVKGSPSAAASTTGAGAGAPPEMEFDELLDRFMGPNSMEEFFRF